MRTLAIVVASALFLALASGCPKDPYDPDTWIDKLDDPASAAAALQRLQQLKDPKAIAPLGKFWQKKNHPSKVLRIIIDLASFEKIDEATGKVVSGPSYAPAVPFLIEAIENFDIGDQQSIDDASVAADALGRAIDSGVSDGQIATTLITAAKKKMPKLSPGQRVRIAAVRSLGKTKNAQAVDVLIDVLLTDATKQPIKLNAAAANALGQAADPKAIQALLKTMFDVPPIYQQCRTALTAIGKPVVAETVKLFQGKNKALEAYAKKNNFANNCDQGVGANTTCKAPGALKFKAAGLLGDFRAADHVKMLAAELKKPPLYSFFDPQTGAGGPPTHNAVLDALRKIGDPRSAKAVWNYVQAADTRIELKPIAIDTYSMLDAKPSKARMNALADMFKNDAEDEGVRLAASLAYGRLVRKKRELAPIKYMIARFKKPADENAKDAKKQSKKADGLEKAGKELEAKALSDKRNTKALMKQANAKFAKAEGYRDEQSSFEGVSNSYRGYQRGFEETLWRAEVGIECGAVPECYAKYLDAEDIGIGKPGLPKVERALLSLGKMGPKGAPVLDKLLSHAATSERMVREGILLAVTRIAATPCDACVAKLAAVVEKQKDQTTLDYLTADTKIVLNYFKWAGR